MNIIRSKSAKKHYERVARHVVSTKTKYFRRNVHINHHETNLRILRIKSDKEFDLEVLGYKSLPEDVCFLLFHMDKYYGFEKYLKINDSEFILTDSKTNKIIALNRLPKNYPDFINIWIVKSNTIEFLKLKLDDLFFTR